MMSRSRRRAAWGHGRGAMLFDALCNSTNSLKNKAWQA
jgi:hypothetical protein